MKDWLLLGREAQGRLFLVLWRKKKKKEKPEFKHSSVWYPRYGGDHGEIKQKREWKCYWGWKLWEQEVELSKAGGVGSERNEVGRRGGTPVPLPPLPVPSSLVSVDTITTQRRRSRRFRFRDGIYRSDTFQKKQRRRVALFGGSFHP